MGPYKLRLQIRFPVLKKHFDHLFEILLELVQSLGLAVRSWKSGDIANVESRILFTPRNTIHRECSERRRET